MLARQHRIVDGADFRRIQRAGTKVRSPYFVVALRPTQTATRFGFVVGKDVGGAVARNRIKRQLRHLAARAISQGLVGFDIVVRVLPEARKANAHELSDSFVDGLRKAAVSS